MTKFRHSLSLFITAILYISLAFLYILFLNTTKPIIKEKPNRIKISILEPKIVKVKPTPQPTIQPTPIIHTPIPIKPKIKLTPKPKITKKHRVKPKPKKRVHKTIVKKAKVVKKRVYKKVKQKIVRTPKATPKPIIGEYIIEPKVVEVYTPPKPKVQKKKIVHTLVPPKIVKKAPMNNLNSKKKRFLKRVRANIYENKHYPLKAKRGRVEGVVHIVFDIEANGEATNIRISHAPSILQRAVRKSLKKSFPVNIPSILKSKFPMRNVSINIDFKLK